MNTIRVFRHALDGLAPIAKIAVVVATILMAVTLFGVARMMTIPEFQSAWQQYKERCPDVVTHNGRGVRIPSPPIPGC